MWFSTYDVGVGETRGGVMAKTFADYARERESVMTDAESEVVHAFDQAAAFGQVIYGARKARNLRQADLAEISGVTQADISRIERGQVAPTTQTLLKLTMALGVEIQFVLTESAGAPTESISLRVPVAG
jgi:XRE family transcriptional regulator, regulator of sulfur utilization